MSAMALVLALAASPVRAAPDSFADLAEKVSPAVVNITTSTLVESGGRGERMLPEGSPFEDFFRDFFDDDGNVNPQPRHSQALGSGFVISEDGFIVTNNHVIEGADEIMIEFYDRSVLEATVVGTDRNTDIALLKVEADEPLAFVPWGDSDVIRVGDWVLAMGNPLGQGFSISAGIVSARGRELSGNYDDYLQTDAAINRGNSGGPLFNMDGEVVGVNTAILSPNGGSIGIGFAMASNVVTKVIDQLKEFGETRRGWLGVSIQDLDPEMAEAQGLDAPRGALVQQVPDGPAKEAGILAGDVILSFDGKDVDDVGHLVRIVGDAAVGATVRVGILRDGETQTILVTLGRREDAMAERRPGPGEDPAPEVAPEPVEAVELGMRLTELTDEMRAALNLDAGVTGLAVVEVEDDSEAFEKGLRSGDVIVEVAQHKVSTIADLRMQMEAVRESGRGAILLLVRRDGAPRFVALSLD
ncbi:MAG: serine protease [Rhodobacterales bacterium]|nr:MAG: serine protease [Rhodobacterales bacterium]